VTRRGGCAAKLSHLSPRDTAQTRCPHYAGERRVDWTRPLTTVSWSSA